MIINGVKVLPVEAMDLADYCKRERRAIKQNPKSSSAKVYKKYHDLIKKGVARDQAFKLAAGENTKRKGAGACLRMKKSKSLSKEKASERK